MCSKNSQAQSERSSSQRPRVDLTMGKQKQAGSSIQKGWFFKSQKGLLNKSRFITKDLDAYDKLSAGVRDLDKVSKSTGDFFSIPDCEDSTDDVASSGAKKSKVFGPVYVRSTKIGQIILLLIKSAVRDAALTFPNYKVHPLIELFLLHFPKGKYDHVPGQDGSVLVHDLAFCYEFNLRCKIFRDDLNSSRFRLKRRNFERNSQESKTKLKKAFGALLRKKKRVYVLRVDLDYALNPPQEASVDWAPYLLPNPLRQPSIQAATSDLKRKWETLSKWIRRSNKSPGLLGHASRLHCFPSIGCRLHVLLIFEWMTYTEGCQLRDAIVRHWEDHLTSGQGIAESEKSSLSVSIFPGCGEISVKRVSQLDEVYKQAIPYLTDMDLYMGRIMKHRTFNMWHLK